MPYPPQMTPPSNIGHYRLGSKLGEGGMGAVYRATDTKLDRQVAIKVLPDAVARDPERLARFSGEAKAYAMAVSPDDRIAFTGRNAQRQGDVYLKRLSNAAAAPELLYSSPNTKHPNDWSHDGDRRAHV